MTKQFHPAAEMFPLIEGEAFRLFVADIKTQGLLDAIVLHDGMILDGRNRYRACLETGIEPQFREWNKIGTPEEFVISKNLHRRHLNDAQRAMIAARLPSLKRGERPNPVNTGFSAGEAARLLNITKSSVESAKRILAKGTDEQIAACDAGKIGVDSTARKLLDKPSRINRFSDGRTQTAQLNTATWGRMRDALINITDLPLAADVAKICGAHRERISLIDKRLERAIKYLEDFRNEWNRD